MASAAAPSDRGPEAEANAAHGSAALSLRREDDGRLVVVLGGRWRVAEHIPTADRVQSETEERPPRQVAFDTGDLDAWDSGLVSFVARVVGFAAAAGIEVDRGGLPAGVQRLLALAEAVPVRTPSRPKPPPSWLARIGEATIARQRSRKQALAFVGDVTRAFGRVLRARARFRSRDVFLQMQLAGAQALGVVTLVSFLVGLILAFVGSVQLEAFGATMYVADLVGISIVRDMGAIMTAIVLAGRTGAAYAAELGTMHVTQEIDALTTLGISPVEFLVLPRLIALTAMMPLLCIYADAVGVLGGGVVTVGMMDIQPAVYRQQTIDAVTVGHFVGGLVKATVYGGLVAAAGCFEGLRCGRSAAAVGRASTAAVVDGIVLIIAAAGVFAVAFYALGIG